MTPRRAESGRAGLLDGDDGAAAVETRNAGCQTDMPASADVEREETDMQDFEYVDASGPVLNDLKEKTPEHQPLDEALPRAPARGVDPRGRQGRDVRPRRKDS